MASNLRQGQEKASHPIPAPSKREMIRENAQMEETQVDRL